MIDADAAKAAAGGLQEHSVGSLYPWAVVGRGPEKAWEVHNLAAGTVVHYKGAVWQGPIKEALAVAYMVKEGIRWMDGYTEGPAPLSEHEKSVLAALEQGDRKFRAMAVAYGASQRPCAGRPRDLSIYGTDTGRMPSSYPQRATEALTALGELPPLDVVRD